MVPEHLRLEHRGDTCVKQRLVGDCFGWSSVGGSSPLTPVPRFRAPFGEQKGLLSRHPRRRPLATLRRALAEGSRAGRRPGRLGRAREGVGGSRAAGSRCEGVGRSARELA